MFSKTADQTAGPSGTPSSTPPAGTAPAPAPRPPSVPHAGKSVLGTDLKISGEITSTGSIEIFGEIDGNITAQGLVVGQEGRVTGTLKADTVEVKGRVDGKINSGSFAMRSTAQVAADVTYGALVIESGAQIEGRFAKPKA